MNSTSFQMTAKELERAAKMEDGVLIKLKFLDMLYSFSREIRCNLFISQNCGRLDWEKPVLMQSWKHKMAAAVPNATDVHKMISVSMQPFSATQQKEEPVEENEKVSATQQKEEPVEENEHDIGAAMSRENVTKILKQMELTGDKVNIHSLSGSVPKGFIPKSPNLGSGQM